MTKNGRRYSSVAVPTDLIEVVQELVQRSGLYRTHSEFFIDGGRRLYLKIIKSMYQKKKVLRKSVKRNTSKSKITESIQPYPRNE